jgi:multimeric flavodoxin WrbA
MPKVGFVYYTKTDVTGDLVYAAISELECKGVDVIKHQIKGSEIVEGRFINSRVFELLANCDAIVFGSPTYMGGAAAQFKAFADASSQVWSSQQWSGKIAAGITSGTSLNGDQSSTLQYFSILASQQGMYWVGLSNISQSESINRLGCELGVVAHSEDGRVNALDLETARHLAVRIAEAIKK